jgi:hypothetical protein
MAERRFHLADALILLVPTALAGATFRRGPDLVRFLRQDGFLTANLGAWYEAVGAGLALCWPGLAGFTLAWLWLRMRPPRPARPRLWRQPGAVALGAAGAVLGLEALGCAILVGIVGWGSVEDFLGSHAGPLLPLPGAAVVGSWVTLAASRRWRAERSWVDRSGRALGAAWVVLAALSLGHQFWSEVTAFVPFSRWVERQAALQERQRQLFERHQERERARLARHDDLHALRKHFLSRGSADQVREIDRLLDEWRAREGREIAEEQREQEELLEGTEPSSPPR